MSFGSKSKTPALPAMAPGPDDSAQVKARQDKADATMRVTNQATQATDTNVGGRAIALEEQAGRGLLNMQKRQAARRALNG